MRAAGLVACLALAACAPDRTVFVGGPVLTLDAQDRVVEALAIEGDRIGAVGDEAAVRAWAGESAEVVDLEGRALLPGFIDAHGHFPGVGLFDLVADLQSPPVGPVESIDDVVAALREQAAAGGPDDWILGAGYDDTLLAEGRHPTRDDLDRVSRERPVFALHTSGHLGAANSAALERIGVGDETPDPEGGVYRRDPGSGRLDGVVEETAMLPMMEALLDFSLWESVQMVRAASRRYLAAGVTTAQMGYADARQADGVALLSRLGLVPLRIILWPEPALADAMLAGDREFASHDDEWLRWGAVKIVADGSLQGYTGYLTEPYHVPPGDDPGYRGYPRVPREALFEQVKRYHAAGLQVAVHGNGDASIDDILDAFEAAQAARPRRDARPIVIHAQTARPDQLDRMAAAGVIPSFFVLHTFYWGDRHRDVFLGPERAARISPLHSADARGVRYSIHCDAPVVPMEPVRLVHSAVNRRTRSGRVLGEEERVSPMRALRAVTIDAAFQHYEESLKGSLEPGKLADLVILSRSPLERPESIDEIEVLETWVGGERVYRAGGGVDG